MTGPPKSRWADSEEDAAAEAQRKREKEEKRRAKAEKQRKLEEAAQRQKQNDDAASTASQGPQDTSIEPGADDPHARPAKRRKTSPSRLTSSDNDAATPAPRQLLRFMGPEWGPCRHVDNFERLNHIEEGSYGWVSRARETATGEVVALKKLKMAENAADGFPVTALREIQTLAEARRHRHVVELREVVVGDGLSEYVAF